LNWKDEIMRVAIMQPYFWPYLGYFQLIDYADIFVIYDDIKYVKKGWINRNRILINGKDEYITLPLKKDSDYLDVRQRRLSDDFAKEAECILRRLLGAYRKAPYFEPTIELAERCLRYPNHNLFDFILHSICSLIEILGIQTEIVISSSLVIDRSLHGQDRVLATCESLGATEYINLPGGRNLYSRNDFNSKNMTLHFLDPELPSYKQSSNSEFIENLSVIDALMWIGASNVKQNLKCFTLKD
jgi:hypothetical protein